MTNLKKKIAFGIEMIRITIKQLTEYKSNFYFSVLTEILYSTSNLIMLYLLFNVIGEYINIGFRYFVFILILNNTISTLLEIFLATYYKSVFNLKKDGEFNMMLIRPIEIKTQYIFSYLNSSIIVMAFIDLLLLFSCFMFLDIVIYNWFFFFLCLLIIFTFLFSMQFFIISLDFIFENSSSLLSALARDVNETFTKYPVFLMQDNIKKKIFLSFFQAYLIGYLVVIFMDKTIIDNLFYYLLFLIIGIVIFSITSIIIWKNGLKNYEAYN